MPKQNCTVAFMGPASTSLTLTRESGCRQEGRASVGGWVCGRQAGKPPACSTTVSRRPRLPCCTVPSRWLRLRHVALLLHPSNHHPPPSHPHCNSPPPTHSPTHTAPPLDPLAHVGKHLALFNICNGVGGPRVGCGATGVAHNQMVVKVAAQAVVGVHSSLQQDGWVCCLSWLGAVSSCTGQVQAAKNTHSLRYM